MCNLSNINIRQIVSKLIITVTEIKVVKQISGITKIEGDRYTDYVFVVC